MSNRKRLTKARATGLTAGLLTGLTLAQSPPALTVPVRLLPPEFKCPLGDYPAAAMRANAQGVVRVRVVVAEGNRIESTEIVRSAGDQREHKMLDQVSLQNARACSYGGSSTVEPGAYIVEYRWSIR